MQAHPQSTPAARIPSTSSPTASRPATIVAPPPTQSRVRFLDPHNPSPVAEFGGLAHDAGNLLGALTLYCDLLSAPGVLRPEHSHYATELNLIASRSSTLIQRLLSSTFNTSRPLATNSVDFQPVELRRCDVPPATRHLAEQSFANTLRNLAPVLERIAAGAASVTVSATLPQADLFPETIGPEALERITVNLVRNAAEAIRTQRLDLLASASAPVPPGEIRVALAVVVGKLQLSIEDNGPGIPPGIAAAFLQPTPLPPGTLRGLGHRIVHELVTSSGGQLSIRVRPGRGSAFCIKWPLSSKQSIPTASTFAYIPSTLKKGTSQC